jgi:uncharacterized delta-60 repeat protein
MKRLLAFLALHLCMKVLLAQPGALDLSFDPGSGVNGSGALLHVGKICTQTDGKILIGGNFTSYNGKVAINLARVQPDGSLDTSFHSPASCSSWVRDMRLQPDGKIVVVGDFDNYDSLPIGRIVRLHSNGQVDTSFRTGLYFDQAIYGLALQADGKIICGGLFTNYDGTACNRLARLNTDGTLDTSFHTQVGATASVGPVIVQPDGNILIGGDFTSYDGDYCFRVARVKPDGRRDSTFTALPGSSAVIYDMALQPDGKIIIAGNLNTYDFQSRKKLARLLPNGGLDPSFYVSQGADVGIGATALLDNGQLLIGGGFKTYNSDSAGGLALLDNSSVRVSSFNPNGKGANDGIADIQIQPDGKILISGFFTSYNGTPRKRIARLYNCLTPQPDSIYGSSYALCSGTTQTYSIAPVSGATKYEWTLPNGWSGSSDSTSIIATGNGAGGSITVKAFTDSCGWSYTTTRAIATIQPPGVDICLVTVDSASTHNIILWEKPVTAIIDSFFIYRETSSNVYSKVGAVGYQDLSEFHDDTTANPNSTSYRYKLSVLDTCGAESELSPFHRTIHLQNLGNGNFQWTFYQIQGQSNPVVSFNINRDNLGNGNFFPIGNVPGTNATFTDITFNSFSNSEYVVDVDWSISCTPTRQVNTTRSNIRKKTMIDFPLAVEEAAASNITLNVYPNPATETILLQFSDGSRPTAAYVLNSLGEKVAPLQAATHTVDVSSLAAGIYLLYAESAAGVFKTRVCVY